MEIHLKKSVPHRFKSVGIWFEFGPYGSLSDISNSEYLNEWVLIELHARLLLLFRYLNLFPCIYNSWNSGNELLFRIDSTRFAFFYHQLTSITIDIFHVFESNCLQNRIELPTKCHIFSTYMIKLGAILDASLSNCFKYMPFFQLKSIHFFDGRKKKNWKERQPKRKNQHQLYLWDE